MREWVTLMTCTKGALICVLRESMVAHQWKTYLTFRLDFGFLYSWWMRTEFWKKRRVRLFTDKIYFMPLQYLWWHLTNYQLTITCIRCVVVCLVCSFLSLRHSCRTTPLPCISSSPGETSASPTQAYLSTLLWTTGWQTSCGSQTHTSSMTRSPLSTGWQWRTGWSDCTLMALCSTDSGGSCFHSLPFFSEDACLTDFT